MQAKNSNGTTVGKFSIFNLLCGRFTFLPSFRSLSHYALLLSCRAACMASKSVDGGVRHFCLPKVDERHNTMERAYSMYDLAACASPSDHCSLAW